jgi:leader peptidase (prepilin peptidase)/N-methyltransferase
MVHPSSFFSSLTRPACTLPMSPNPFVPSLYAVDSWPLVLVTFAVGACIGSFSNVCIHRLPADESVIRPPSRCPRCAAAVVWYDNIPLVSWVVLGGRCRACSEPISVRYPAVEGSTGVLAVLALVVFGPTLQAVVAFAFTAALLLITFIDLDHMFIPDEVSLPGIGVGIAAAFLDGPPAPLDAIAGVALGGGALWLVAWSYERLTGVEGMGFGDVKLLAMMGAFLGWQAIPVILVVASITGSLAGVVMILVQARPALSRVRQRLGTAALAPYVRRAARRTELPFGPFLALGALVALYAPGLDLL